VHPTPTLGTQNCRTNRPNRGLLALNDAVSDGVISRNVAAAVKAAQFEGDSPLSPEQLKTFLQAARGDRFESLYVLTVHCRLREGELLGLKWENLDLAEEE
jgi:integrase